VLAVIVHTEEAARGEEKEKEGTPADGSCFLPPRRRRREKKVT